MTELEEKLAQERGPAKRVRLERNEAIGTASAAVITAASRRH
jgi:hypothetical protein